MGFLKGGAGLLRLRKHNIGHKDIFGPMGGRTESDGNSEETGNGH